MFFYIHTSYAVDFSAPELFNRKGRRDIRRDIFRNPASSAVKKIQLRNTESLLKINRDGQGLQDNPVHPEDPLLKNNIQIQKRFGISNRKKNDPTDAV